MHRFQNILYTILGPGTQTAGLRQALGVARKNGGRLNALAICPELPANLEEYRRGFEESLLKHLETSLETARSALGIDEKEVPVDLEVEFGHTPGLRMVKKVLRDRCDLIVKEAEPHEGGKGFQAVDMQLLRKCPCPVWLCRPAPALRDKVKIAVAVDPEDPASAADGLALRLLELARSLADNFGGELHVVSCWSFEFEESLRQSVWYRIPEEQLSETLVQVRARHRSALDALIHRANLEGGFHLHHLHGQPENVIPIWIARNKIDLLVMGTVARTGIPGFLIGNTAENMLQKISCSLLALKPRGFVSPVKIDA